MDGRVAPAAMPRRVLFYTVNGKGFGHLMRALAIAGALRRAAPDARILFATSCEDPGVIWREGFHYVKMLAPEAQEAHGRGRERHRQLAERMVRATLAAFRPHVLVVDSFAYGSVGELRRFLGGPWRRVLVSNLFLLQRDVDRYRESVGHYDVVVFPFDAAEAAGHPALVDLSRPAVFAGPIAGITRDGLLPRDVARAMLGLPADGPIVLLAAGGGGGASVVPVLARMAAAIPLVPETGFALLEPPLARELPPIPWDADVRVVRRVPIAPCLAAFDAAVTTAGMNSAAELMVAGLPMVWLPLGSPSHDQGRNVARWTARGIGCRPAGPDAAALAAAIRHVLDPATAAAMRAAMAGAAGAGAAGAGAAGDGAARAAAAILGLEPRPEAEDPDEATVEGGSDARRDAEDR
ncbi:MAG: hypothetical protein IT561_24755 [Alphaproteobacteria bacterium]|nr:hypothetical protein [Alphaproteobacteria bacterium]